MSLRKLFFFALVAGNVGFWALNANAVSADEVASFGKQCWWTPLTMGCSEYFQPQCTGVSQCSN